MHHSLANADRVLHLLQLPTLISHGELRVTAALLGHLRREAHLILLLLISLSPFKVHTELPLHLRLVRLVLGLERVALLVRLPQLCL